jgi:hypothetical protein
MANEKFSQLPTVSASTLGDIIAAVQSGVSVQQTLQQVYDLFQSNVVLNFAGNPNGSVAGVPYQLCWDTTDGILYVCVTAGTTNTAVWQPVLAGNLTNGQLLIGSSGNPPVPANLTAGTNITITNTAGGIEISASGAGGFSWNSVTTTPQPMLSNNGYICLSSSQIILPLPTTSKVGDELEILSAETGGFLISQGAGQSILAGVDTSTVGTGGSISTTDKAASVYLVCVVANTTWQYGSGPQGNIDVT